MMQTMSLKVRVAMGLCLAVGTAVCKAEEAQRWLDLMDQAMATLQYQGVLVYVHDGAVEAMQITRSYGPNGIREHVVSLTGDRREVIRETNEIRSNMSGVGGLAMAQASTTSWVGLKADESGDARKQYQWSVLGDDRVAGYDAAVVEAIPNDRVRYAYRLWVARDTGMLLGSSVRAIDGAPIERMMFTQVRMTPGSADSATSVSDLQPAPTPSGAWRVEGLPQGFRLVAAPGQDARGVEHLLFSDGLATLSVYVEPPGSFAADWTAAMRRGGVNVFGRVLDGRRVVVMGDLPAATVEQVARSVTPTGAAEH
jgi:sigma-E factor negative regulatory protein RseB